MTEARQEQRPAGGGGSVSQQTSTVQGAAVIQLRLAGPDESSTTGPTWYGGVGGSSNGAGCGGGNS